MDSVTTGLKCLHEMLALPARSISCIDRRLATGLLGSLQSVCVCVQTVSTGVKFLHEMLALPARSISCSKRHVWLPASRLCLCVRADCVNRGEVPAQDAAPGHAGGPRCPAGLSSPQPFLTHTLALYPNPCSFIKPWLFTNANLTKPLLSVETLALYPSHSDQTLALYPNLRSLSKSCSLSKPWLFTQANLTKPLPFTQAVLTKSLLSIQPLALYPSHSDQTLALYPNPGSLPKPFRPNPCPLPRPLLFTPALVDHFHQDSQCIHCIHTPVTCRQHWLQGRCCPFAGSWKLSVPYVCACNMHTACTSSTAILYVRPVCIIHL